MFSVPLPFIAGLVFALVLYITLRGVETPGSRRYFLVFLCFYALQGMIVGLRFGYGVHWLGPVQPVTASIMPPLAYLAFRSLAASPVERPWRHLAMPLATALAVTFVPPLTDVLLAINFVVYGVLLHRLTRHDTEAVAQASLNRVVPALRAARLTAGLMIFFAVTDAMVSVSSWYFGPASVPTAVALMNLAVIAAVLVYYVLPEPQPLQASAAEPSPDTGWTEEDRAILQRVEAALDAGDLYRQESLSLARLARKAGLPARDVSAAINRLTQLNVSQFVNTRRIREACRLLEETDRPLMTVMFDCGFATKSNFNREFRRVTGMSPTQWRSHRRKA